MCGIVSVIKKIDDGVPTAPVIMSMFEKQKTRGSQGLGYVSFDEKLGAYVRRQTVTEIEKAIEKNDKRSILFHHRFPTSTGNYSDSAHPIKVSHEELLFDYYVVHNGIISNDSVMREKHIALGYDYNTKVVTKTETKNYVYTTEQYNDSEAFAIDISRFIEGRSEEIESSGSIAFIALQVDKETQDIRRVYFGRNLGNPLTIKYTDGSLVLRSVGEEEMLEANELFSLDMKDWSVESFSCNIGHYYSAKTNWGNINRKNNDVEYDYGKTQVISDKEEDLERKRDAEQELVELYEEKFEIEQEIIQYKDDVQQEHYIDTLTNRIDRIQKRINFIEWELEAYTS